MPFLRIDGSNQLLYRLLFSVDGWQIYEHQYLCDVSNTLFFICLKLFCFALLFPLGPPMLKILLSVTEKRWMIASGERSLYAMFPVHQHYLLSKLKLLQNYTWLTMPPLTTTQQGALSLHTGDWNQHGCAALTTQQWGMRLPAVGAPLLNTPCAVAAESVHWVRLKYGIRKGHHCWHRHTHAHRNTAGIRKTEWKETDKQSE